MIVGIDFGTSTSEIAFVNEKKKIELVPNHIGEFITPSVVHISENGKITVGKEAKERALLEPECTFLEVKRLFGKQGTLLAWGKSYTPVDVAAMIINYLVNCAKEHTKQDIDKAVITVPAYFTDGQRKDIMAAGKAAGLTVERIINEPTAASLDYGVNHMEEIKNILVYDLGGGTLDVTVLELFEGVVDVKSSCGNSGLGGKDFDQALIDHLCKRIKKKNKLDIRSDVRAMMRIKIAAEECKEALSQKQEFDISLPFLCESGGSPIGLSERISRSDFEKLIQEKVLSTKEQVNTALEDAGITHTEVDLVLLVGGSTRMPFVANFLENEYGFSPESSVDADLAVVRGAAIQAGVLGGVLGEDAIVLTDICPHSLSTGALVFDNHYEYDLRCSVIIPRNTVLPAEKSNLYQTAFDNQNAVRVTVYQGEGEFPEENILLGSFYMTGIPKGKAGKEAINIKFCYDLNGILDVSADVVSTGKTASIIINTAEVGENMDLSTWKKADEASKYRKLINKADRLVKVHGEYADELNLAADNLKKGLVLGWDIEVLDLFSGELNFAIDELEG